MSKLKKAAVAAIAVFISIMVGANISPETVETICVKIGVCEVVVEK